jgi:hypothetical protein
MANCESPPALTDEKGVPLSVFIAAGNPNSLKVRSKLFLTFLNVGFKYPSHAIINLLKLSVIVRG